MQSLKKMPTKIIQKAEFSILEHSYDRLNIGIIASLFCATIVYIGLHNIHQKTRLMTWFFCFLAVALARFFIKLLFDSSQSTQENFKLWKNLFIAGALFSGVIWGALGGFIFPIVGNLQQVLCLLMLSGVTAGSIASLSGVLFASIGFLLVSLLPYVVIIALSHNFIHRLFDLALVGYVIYLIALSVNTHLMIKKIIYLQFENIALVEKLGHLATHDPLLHIDNSRLFYVNLKNSINRAERANKLLALLYIDIDNFKQVNDTYGHSVGDKFLLKVVSRIKNTLRATDLIARVGGDEFAIILESFENKETVADVTRKICDAVSATTIKIEHAEIEITISVGIGIYPVDGVNPKKLIRSADNAMYYAKKTGRNRFCFSEDMENVL